MSYIDRIKVQGTEYDVLDRRVRLADGQDFDYGTLVQGGINNTNGYTTDTVLRRSETYWPVIEGPVNIVMSNGLVGYIRLYDANKTMLDPDSTLSGADTTNHRLVTGNSATLTVTMKEYNPNTAYFRFYFSCGTKDNISALVRENARIVPLQTVVTPNDLHDVADGVTALDEDVSDLKSHVDNGNLYVLINQRQMWNPYEVVTGGRYYCDGTYNAKSDYCYLQFPVAEGQVYYFATPDPTSASGKKTGTAHYVCPVKSDGTYYYDNATAVTWTDQYTVPANSGITSLIVSIPLSRLGPDGLYSITSDPLSAANKYSPRFFPAFDTIAETVALNNLLSGTTWTNEYVSVVTGGTTSNDGYRTSDYIPVVGGNYVVSTWKNQRRQMFSCAVYDADKNVIAAESVTGDGFQRQSGYFRLPAGAAYIRVTYTTANFDTEYNYLYQYQYNIGYVTKNFSLVKDTAIPGVLERISALENTGKSRWSGKKFLAIGDSQTAQGKWEPFVASTLGMTAYIKGFSGRTVAVSNPSNTGDCISSDYNIGQIDSYIADGHDDFDVVLIMGGTNDWGYDGVIHDGYANILIGTDADTGNTTFKGALKKLVKHFSDTYPSKVVVIMSNIGGRTRDPGTDTVLTDMTAPLLNANGYCQATFAQAAKEVAEYVGVPFIDVYSCGITIYNSATYLEDGLHINSGAGAKLVANTIINGLQNIQPYNE